MKGIFERVALILLMMVNSFHSSLAALDPNQLIDTIGTGTPTSTSPVDLVKNGINWAIGLIGFVAVVFLIVAGVKYITANGDEKKVEEAQKGITNSIIGLIICFLAVMIVNFVLEKVATW